MTLEAATNEAAFWGEYICINCRNRQEEAGACEECGDEVASALFLTQFLSQIDEERSEDL